MSGLEAIISSKDSWSRSDSESYWRREQDYLCGSVRQMRKRESPTTDPRVYAHSRRSGRVRSLAYPNVFITKAPAEWRFLSTMGCSSIENTLRRINIPKISRGPKGC